MPVYLAMKVRPALVIIFLLLILSGVELFYTQVPLSYEKTAQIMGTTVRVKIFGRGAPYWASRAIYEIERIDHLFSKFDPSSEISLINKLAGKAPLQVSPDTFSVLKLAQEVNRTSHGAFDVTLGHPEALTLDKVNRKVKVESRKVKLDLGGIGKGYAVEAARQLLLKKRVRRAIIDMHSSIAVIGNGWKIGILDPRNRNKMLGMVVLNDGEALSTSGQYEQPGHIIDPRTGKPADKCLSVTVIARDAAMADALSTAIFVLGPEEGMRLIEKLPCIEGLVVDVKGKVLKSLGFQLK